MKLSVIETLRSSYEVFRISARAFISLIFEEIDYILV